MVTQQEIYDLIFRPADRQMMDVPEWRQLNMDCRRQAMAMVVESVENLDLSDRDAAVRRAEVEFRRKVHDAPGFAIWLMILVPFIVNYVLPMVIDLLIAWIKHRRST